VSVDSRQIEAPFSLEFVHGRVVEYGQHEATIALRAVAKTIGQWRGLVGKQAQVDVRDGDARDERARQARVERERLLAERGPGITSVPPEAPGQTPPADGQ
jgi:hypothetical protein